MNPKRIFPTCIVALLCFVFLTSVTGCLRSPSETEHRDGSVRSKAESHDHQTLWTCPMHPQIRQDVPGSCPICGMDLVRTDPKTSEKPFAMGEPAPDGHAAFELSLGRRQMIGVKTGVVEKKPLFKSIEAPGRIAFDPELYTAQNEYREAMKQREWVKDSTIDEVKVSARRMIESTKLRLKILGLSDAQIKNLENDGSEGHNLLIPKAGEHVWVYAEVFEMDLPLVKPGLEADVRDFSSGSELYKGKVVSVDRVIHADTRTAKVRILIPDSKILLRPNAFVSVTINSPMGEQIAIPFDAVLETGKQAWVFVVDEEFGKFEPRLVTILDRAGDDVAVGSGVKPGERIVTSANFLIDSESRLKSVLTAEWGNRSSESGEMSGSPDKDEEEGKSSLCPEGQFWHEQMSHCMAIPDR